MTAGAPVPLRSLVHLRLRVPCDGDRLRGKTWVPVGRSELNLCAQTLPLAARFDDGPAALGLVTGAAYQTRPLLDTAGRWRLGYLPLALRCSPFAIRGSGDDPLDDVVLPDGAAVVGPDGTLPIVDREGRAAPHVVQLQALLRALAAGRDRLSAALERLAIADVLVPIAAPPPRPGESDAVLRCPMPELLTIDRRRFATLSRRALGALAGPNFDSIDVAVSMIFSQRLLEAACLAQPAPEEADRSTSLHRSTPGTVWPEDLRLALDDSRLFSLDDLAQNAF